VFVVGVQFTLFCLDSMGVERIPVVINVEGSQGENRLCAGDSPTHARLFHPVLHQVATIALHDAAADRVTGS